MADWTLTKGLQHLRDQVNEAFPRRDQTSDGTIGDAAHQAETSGHNPDDTRGSRPEWDGDQDSTPEVRAWDMDSDLGDPDVSAQDLVDHLRRLPKLGTVIRYMIYNRRMYHVDDNFAGRAYTGASPHTEHVHFSGARSQSADNDTAFDYQLEELVMPTAEEIADAVWAKADKAGIRNGRTVGGTLDALAVNSVATVGALKTLAAKDAGVDEQALAAALAPAVAALVVAALPEGAVTSAQLQAAIVGALRELAAPAA